MTDLHYLGLLEVSERIRKREITSEAVTQAILDRIAKLDGELNSFLLVLKDRALEEARRADKEIESGLWRGPLHGVPIGLKDLLYVKDVTTTSGTAIMKDFKPSHDSTVARRLAAAGAVLVGKLHTTEAATMDHHPSLPRPKNPWHGDHWTGVSSSGSGVSTAAGLCYGALGTDTGGSIRLPSASNGLSGIKPTWGRVSRYGCFPLGASWDHIGPMTRSTANSAAMLKAIAGHDPDDPTSLPKAASDYLTELGKGVSGLTLGIDWAYATDNVAPEVAQAVKDAVALFEEMGAHIVEVKFPSVASLMGEVMPALSAEVAWAHEATYPSQAELYGPRLKAMIEGGRGLTAIDVARANLNRMAFAGNVAAIFETIDVLICPTLPRAAPTWDEMEAMADDMLAMGANLMRYTLPFNATGSPTLSVPCGFAGGLPLSLQFVGRHLGEDVICRVGHAYQQRTDFHTRHPALG